MPAAFFVVRATVADPARRAAFDRWYETEHVPDAVKAFGVSKAWRFWSLDDPALHQAMYQFDDEARLAAMLKGDALKQLRRRFRPRLARRQALARDADAGAGICEVARFITATISEPERRIQPWFMS